ncbi:MAG: TPM domain-containing protein [Lacunisphaera sp.]
MNKAIFIKQLDHSKIEATIARAELLTSGEIRVAVIHEPAGNPLAKAQALFLRLGMTKTKNRNAVLIMVAPASQTFAIIGDEGVHEKCGAQFWQELTSAMSGFFKRGDFTAGLAEGIERAGRLLAGHFPRQPDDKNELPDTVIES